MYGFKVNDAHDAAILSYLFCRPVVDAHSAVEVQVEIVLHQILDLNCRDKMLVTSLWKRLVSENPTYCLKGNVELV